MRKWGFSETVLVIILGGKKLSKNYSSIKNNKNNSNIQQCPTQSNKNNKNNSNIQQCPTQSTLS